MDRVAFHIKANGVCIRIGNFPVKKQVLTSLARILSFCSQVVWIASQPSEATKLWHVTRNHSHIVTLLNLSRGALKGGVQFVFKRLCGKVELAKAQREGGLERRTKPFGFGDQRAADTQQKSVDYPKSFTAFTTFCDRGSLLYAFQFV